MEPNIKQIYLDNASTTFPKPEQVSKAVYEYMTTSGCNINRGSYDNAYKTEEIILDTRQLLCDLFNGPDCKNVVFTKNITESLNFILKGYLKSGDHVLVSEMEHNAIMRPLTQLTNSGISFTRIPCDNKGQLVLDNLDKFVNESTKMLIITHASNVCGTVMPLEALGDFCKKHDLLFIVDTAQTAGILNIDMKKMNIDALAFTGHKGLLGPQGTGGFIITDRLINAIEPLISGGSGSISHLEEIPTFMPDRFEAGTPNIPGIIGLYQGLLFIKETGINNILSHELELTKIFLEGLEKLENLGDIKIIGKKNTDMRVGVVSIQTLKTDMASAAFMLDDKYHIMTRVGMHCAPSAHKALGTYPEGTLRFSFGWWNTKEDVQKALTALEEICHGI